MRTEQFAEKVRAWRDETEDGKPTLRAQIVRAAWCEPCRGGDGCHKCRPDVWDTVIYTLSIDRAACLDGTGLTPTRYDGTDRGAAMLCGALAWAWPQFPVDWMTGLDIGKAILDADLDAACALVEGL
jgi:hypothetical protein